ncbi:MAG: hypothetical protein EXR71_02000 [Myxococcales bacterium]|nr:hypothetical protein [Myxococcales bacterium]
MDTAPDGAAYVLSGDDHAVCWWIVDDLGEARVVKRWTRSDRHAIRVEALADGRAFLVMSDLRVQVRNVDDDHYRNLDLTLPGTPIVVLAHARRDWVAVTIPRDDDTVLVQLLDLDRERILAGVALPARDLALSFVGDGEALWLDGAHALALTEGGLSVRGQSPR